MHTLTLYQQQILELNLSLIPRLSTIIDYLDLLAHWRLQAIINELKAAVSCAVCLAATPRFYFSIMEKQLEDKIWKWPGNEATLCHELTYKGMVL